MSKGILELAQKNKVPFLELLDFVQKNKNDFQIWMTNGEWLTEQKPSKLMKAFYAYQHEQIFAKVTAICEQMGIKCGDCNISSKYVKIFNFDEFRETDLYIFKETISLLRNIGFTRKYGGNPNEFFKE